MMTTLDNMDIRDLGLIMIGLSIGIPSIIGLLILLLNPDDDF